MSFKKVYQLDEQGFFICETEAHESPLEPGVFLIPGGCVEKAPPKYKDGSMAVFNFETNKWTKVSMGRIVSTPEGMAVQSEEEAERQWRNYELARADIELLKSEDGDGVGEPKDWREYRKNLRAYPSLIGFPTDKGLRPKAPDL